jgi:hypothetical protein
MWMVGIRPRDSFNFLNFGYAISAVTKYNDSTYAVQLNTRFGAPVSQLQPFAVSMEGEIQGISGHRAWGKCVLCPLE